MRSCRAITTTSALINTRTWLVCNFGREAVIFLALFTLTILSWIPRFSGPIDFRWDGGVYYILGTSLAEGKGYKLLNEPTEIDATQYPPLLPAIIAVHQWILSTSDPIIVGRFLRFSFFLLFNVYIFSSYAMARFLLTPIYAFLATAVSLLNFHTYFLSDLCFPEILFALTTTLFIIFNRDSRRKISPILAAVFAIASYALRTIGITLLIAWIGESIFNREFKKAFFRLLLALIPVISWQVYISSVESSHSYNNPDYIYQRADYLNYNVSYTKNIALIDPYTPELGYLSAEDMAKRFLHNVAVLPVSLGEAIGVKQALWELGWEWLNKKMPFTPITPWVIYLPLSIIGGLILGGMYLQLARRQWIIPFYILIYLCVFCITPWPSQFPRYLAPLAPFIALSLFAVLSIIKIQARKTSNPRYALGCIAFSTSIIFMIIISESVISVLAYTKGHQMATYHDQNGHEIKYRLFFYNDSYRALDVGLDWLQQQASSTEVVASSMPHWVYLRTGLKSVMPPFEPNAIKAQQLLESVPVNYLILDQGLAVDTKKYTLPVIQNFPERWKRIYSDEIISDSILPQPGQKLDGRFEIYQRVDPQISSSNR